MSEPNILLLYTDQQRFDALGCAGNPDVQTPCLDRLAGSGVRFSRHFVQNPVCMPSRVSMLSGRYPSNLGILKMGHPVPEDLPLVSHRLRGAGYRTACIGKLHFLPHSNRDHRESHPAYGFDHMEVSDEPGPYDDAYRAYIRRTQPDQLDAISAHVYPPAAKVWREAVDFSDPVRHPSGWNPWRTEAFSGNDEATHTAFVGQRTIDFLRGQTPGRPFFCLSGFYSPHSPLVAPQRFLDLYRPESFTLPQYPPELEVKRKTEGFDDETLRQAMHGYYAMVSEVDHWVGEILNTLEASRLLDNTVVVFTSDHGEFLGEHLAWGKWHPAPDCVSRVPLLMSGPGIAPGVSDALVESVDIVPTLLQLAGVSVPSSVDGDSLADALAGNAFEGKEAVLIEDAMHDCAWRGLRTRGHRYILEADGRERLFDLNADFGEYRDLAETADAEALLGKYRGKLARRMIQINHCRPRLWPY